MLGGNHFYLVPKHLHLPKRTTCIHYALFIALLFIIIIIIHCINDYFLKENKTKQNPEHGLQNHLPYTPAPPGASNQVTRSHRDLLSVLLECAVSFSLPIIF